MTDQATPTPAQPGEPTSTPAPASPSGAGGTPAQGGGGQDPAAPASKPERPEHVPAKFWDGEAGRLREDALLKSYGDLERFRTERTEKVPETYQTPSVVAPFADQLGEGELDALYEMAREEGYSQAGVERLAKVIYGDAAGRLAELEQHYGGKEKLAEVQEAVAAFVGTFPSEHQDALRHLTAYPEGVRLLDWMRQERADRPLPGQPGEAAPKHSEGDLKRMMQDPRYWKERDPSFVAEVERGFQELFPGQEETARLNRTGR